MNTTADVFQIWQDTYAKAEQVWTEPLNEVLESEAFVTWMSTTRDAMLTQQKAATDGAEKYWDALRLPTKTDLASVSALVVALEEKLDRALDSLDVLEKKPGATVSTKSLEDKLDVLEKKIGDLAIAKSLEAKVDRALAAIEALDKKVTAKGAAK